MVAVRESLPWSFTGLLAGLLVFLFLMHGSLVHRISQAELPAFGVMSAALVAILSVRLARAFGFVLPAYVFACVVAFVASLPRPYAFADPLAYLHRVGASGLFLAIFIALAAAGILLLARRVAAPAWRADLLGVLIVLVLAAVAFATNVSLGNGIVALLQPLGMLGDSYAALLVVVIVEMLLWLVGIHGPATLAAIVTPVYLTLQQQNTDAYAHHRALPHIVVVSLFLFVFPGGAGATLPLAALLAFSKVKRLRTLARATFVPALFNVNEPLLFGLPIVFNPSLAIPFVGVPIVLATTTYFAVAAGLVARPFTYVPAGIPAPISVYLATLDWRAVVLVFVNLGLSTVAYWPFVRAYERREAGV